MRRMPTRPVLRSSLFLLSAALFLGAATAAAESEETVVIRDGVEPASLEVATGTTVTWRNEDDERHRIRSREGPVEFDSGDLEPGDAFSYAFLVEGSYPYLDERDDEASDYFGTVVVGPSPGASTEPVRASASADPLLATAPAERPATGSDDPQTSNSRIDITDRTFVPANITVSVGDSVQWTNLDDEGHTVSATEGAFESGVMAGGVTFSQIFDTPGTFDYACAIHPEMQGTVTVAAPPDPAASGDVPAAGTDVPVSIVDMVYSPATVEVTAGTTVHWTNDDSVIHTVTARDGSFNSGVMQTGDTFSQTFDVPGTYDYFCAIHPLQGGQIVVTDPGG
jgi:plastocyanin